MQCEEKDELLDEIDRTLVLIEKLVADGDGLQQKKAVWFETLAADLEKSVQIVVADRLDHFNGYQFVKLAGQVAVVLFEQRNLVRQPGGGEALGGQSILLV